MHDDVQKLNVERVLDQLNALEQILEGLQTAYVRFLLKLKLLGKAVRFSSGRYAFKHKYEVLEDLDPVLVHAKHVKLLQGRNQRRQRGVKTVQVQN